MSTLSKFKLPFLLIISLSAVYPQAGLKIKADNVQVQEDESVNINVLKNDSIGQIISMQSLFGKNLLTKKRFFGLFNSSKFNEKKYGDYVKDTLKILLEFEKNGETTIEVDKIQPQSGTNLAIGEAGDSLTFQNSVIPNSALANGQITINGVSVSLGGSATIPTETQPVISSFTPVSYTHLTLPTKRIV